MKLTFAALLVIASGFIFFTRTAFAQCDPFDPGGGNPPDDWVNWDDGGGGGGYDWSTWGDNGGNGTVTNTITISADTTSMYAGQSIGIHADFTCGGSAYGGFDCGIFCPEDTLVSADIFSGDSAHIDYTFTPSSPGSYTFYARQAAGGIWFTFATVTVNVTGSNNPNVSASAPNIYPGQTTTVSWNASDVDGDFDHVDVYITRSGSPYWDYLGSAGASGSFNWQASAHFNSNTPAFGSYLFVVRAWDSRGGYTDSNTFFDVINRAPVTTLNASSTNIILGQTTTITAASTDPDGNLINQTIDYLVPGASSWVSGGTVTGASWSGGMTGGHTLVWTVPASILNHCGTGPWQVRASAGDGFTTSNIPSVSITVAKATPAVSNWPTNRAIANNTGYSVTTADLNAGLANPYSTSVVQPTGGVTYSIFSGGSGPIGVGTVLQPGDYIIRATYAGDANYNATTFDAIWIIDNPVTTIQADVTHADAGQTGTIYTGQSSTIYFGQTVAITAYSADKDALLVSQTIDYSIDGGTSWTSGSVPAGSAWSGGPAGSHTLAWTVPVSVMTLGQRQVRASGSNNLGYVSNLATVSVTVAKATPSVSNWSDQTFPTTHVVASADLGAAFANPYTSSVAQPTGASTYSIVPGGSGPVTVGTKLYPGTYTIRASYPGDANYNPLAADIVWTVINHPPVTTLTASAMNIGLGQTVTLTAVATDTDENLVSQTIDYLPPNSSSWVVGAATWSGGMTASHTLTLTVPGSTLTTPGIWKFRSTGGDGMAAPNYANLSVMVAFGITGPTGLKIYRPAP